MAGHKKIANKKTHTRLRRKAAIRKRVRGTAERPRLSVFRSLKHIYVQAIDDDSNKIVATASDQDKTLRDALAGKKKKERAREVGKAIGEKLVGQKVEAVVFDRNGYIYHGRVKEVADGARDAGLKF
jgi:large subunit ribosomal protein L18